MTVAVQGWGASLQATVDETLAQAARQGGGLSVWQATADGWRALGCCGAVPALPAAAREVSCDAYAGAIRLLRIVHGGDALSAALAGLLAARVEAEWLREEQRFAGQLRDIMVTVGQLADEVPSLEAFLSRLYAVLSPLLPDGALTLGLTDDEGGCLRFPVNAWPAGADAFVHAEPALLAAAGRRQRLWVLGRRRLATLCPGVPAGHLPLLWVAVPLLDEGGRLLAIASARVDALYPGDTRVARRRLSQLARHLCSQLGQLGRRLQLLGQLRRVRVELDGYAVRLNAELAERRRNEQLVQALGEVNTLANSLLPLPAVLAGVRRTLGRLVEFDTLTVALYAGDDGDLAFPYRSEGIAQQPAAAERALFEQVLHSGRPVLSGRPAQAGEDGATLRSWLGVPLFDQQRLLGVIAIGSHAESRRFGLREQETVEFVAGHVGGAVARLQATQALYQVNSQLEVRVQQRTRALDEANARLKYESLHDTLTALPNRAYFGQRILQLWQQYALDESCPFALMLIDMDRFKLVNDTLGHAAGDALLVEVGERIRACLRPDDFLARLGGDEFALLLPGPVSYKSCDRVARRIVDAFRTPVVVEGRELFTTLSLGVVLSDGQYHAGCQDMLRDADLAMYHSKQQGRDGYTVYNHALRQGKADQLALEAELRHALEGEHELVPYFQPFVDAASGAVTGFETLVRWRHPERGLIPPALFLPMAQESGLIRRLDRYMIVRACEQLARWRTEGRANAQCSLHINLSSENLRDDDLAGWIAGVLQRCGLPPNLVYLEVTESALIDVPGQAQRVMQALHDVGVRLALDDFGTGYSALSYLHRYRFDLLKIDQAFVREVGVNAESTAIVRAILALAQALQLEVVAEGVETAEQVDALRALGCPRLQGYYFSPPRPAGEVYWGAPASVLAG